MRLAISIQGTCEDGYVCNQGSYSPRPVSDTSNIINSSTEFLVYNGPALRGYYSYSGMNNQPCPTGTYQPSLWSTTCLPCMAGSYCDSLAMGRFQGQNTLCPAGYYCAPGQSNYTSAPLCPTGKISIQGQPQCSLCIDGYFTNTSSVTCTACPYGFFCNSKQLTPQPCLQAQSC